MGHGSGEGKLLAGLVIILIIVLWFPQASSRRRDSLEFRHGRDGRVLLEVHDDCHRLAQPRRVVLGPSYGESFPRCLIELLQGFIVKRARATTCGDKPASELGNGVFLVADSRIPNHTLYVSIPNHTLCVSIPNHTLCVGIPNHTLYVPHGEGGTAVFLVADSCFFFFHGISSRGVPG